ncbi:MFS transporter [Spirosoma endophyticum]|uniref:Predicted arabinose efflux permease, MFS family n=1 Tax=Spirosoma endophyticum TaxID=662367 RepID=A0A1I1LER3_9BACT|nr:MFS transporter [Spirosoma endophyticum]SFC71456.1 Predicted arabinose efflux permease, MFS family [Spirosoma endophyticum]
MSQSKSTSIFSPFQEELFRTLWVAAFISNVGTWMQNVGVSWVAATLTTSPLMISLIQTASSLPALFFSYPAGVISDQSDRRKLLMALQVFLFVVVMLLSLFTEMHLLGIHLLIFFTFLIGLGAAFTTPIWQAITPEVITPARLKEAIALNGVNFNLARAVGPALGGIILTLGGIQSIFVFNAVSFLFLIGGLYRWKNAVSPVKSIEFRKTAIAGLQAANRSKPFRHLLIRTISFTAFVSILFAFLPQLSKYEWKQNSGQYTWLWVSLGIGALVGSYLYGIGNRYLKATQLIFFSCELVAICLFLLSLTANFYLLLGILFITGIGWINATSMMNVLAQQYSPTELKGRFLAINVTVFQGSIALSSLGWGYLSELVTTLTVLKIAAVGMAIGCGMLLFFPLEEAEDVSSESVACADPLVQFHLQ